MNRQNDAQTPWARVVILVGATAALALMARSLTGSVLPKSPEDALIFQSALLLIVLGVALLEHKFTKPADSLLNSLVGVVTLLSVYTVAPPIGWWLVFSYCIVVLAASIICVAVSEGKGIEGWKAQLAGATYGPAVLLGQARVLYSVVFLFALLAFKGMQSPQTLSLVLFWGVFIVIWPLGLPGLLSKLAPHRRATEPLGCVVRVDWPNLIRVQLVSSSNWSYGSTKLMQQADGRQRVVVALYQQSQRNELLGTGLCVMDVEDRIPGLRAGHVYDAPQSLRVSREEIGPLAGGSEGSQLVGFVVEDSAIGEIRVEVWDPNVCKEGMLLSCPIGDQKVYYQIVQGITCEETLEGDRHGFQVARAAQLGTFAAGRGFEKFSWIPAMNAPVFAEPEGFGEDMNPPEGDFRYGTVPGTNIAVTGPFTDMLEYHTAILGITGAGKTELAFDLIRHAVAAGTKVFCIDLTARYSGRLNDLDPIDLTLDDTLARELGNKLFDVEAGKYGGSEEKRPLQEFRGRLESNIQTLVQDFIGHAQHNLAMLTLNEISNTKATLHLTEMYLTRILHYAREHPDDCPRILIVVEEAHTVMPETVGLGDFDSKGLVAKIAQIALQGRKYGVGLLVIAQRTATVSKTVLTQCNTIVAFSCFDDTSLNFLSNYVGKTHVAAIPELQFLQAVVFGKGVRSQRPLIVQIPFSKEKAGAERREPRR